MAYEIAQFDLEQIARSGSGRIAVKVEGFWSSDPITMYINRSFYTDESQWKFTISHSSGGRDTNQIECDLVAERFFAEALIALSDLGIELKGKTSEMEAFYQDQRRIDREAEEIRKAELQKQIEADMPLGESNAKYIVQMMKAKIQKEYQAEVTYFNRGQERGGVITLERARERSTFRINGNRSNYLDVISFLTTRSNRTTLA